MGDDLRVGGNYVASLASAVMRGGEALGAVPDLLKIVLEEESWRRFVTPRGEIIEHDRFVDFATTPPLAGIGADVPLLKRIVQDDPVALDALDRALAGKWGGDRKSESAIKDNNINLDTQSQKPEGTSAEYALRKLRSDAPELHERVLAGELSPHAAMVEAGFRKRTISIPATDPEKAAASIRRNMRPEDIRVLIDYLEGVS